ncbi:zinc knuckle CX2CX4HX4C containing protein [Tanacetum coccineum]
MEVRGSDLQFKEVCGILLQCSSVDIDAAVNVIETYWKIWMKLNQGGCIDVAATFGAPLTTVGDLHKLINDIKAGKHEELLSGMTNDDRMETLDALGSICNSIQANCNHLPSKASPSHPIMQSVNINTKSTSYAGATGVSTMTQTQVNSNFRPLVVDHVFNGVNISILRKVVKKVGAHLEHTLYGYFIGKRLAFPVVEYYARNNWGKHGLKRVMMNTKGLFFFKFESKVGLEVVLESGPWMIRNTLIILKKWSMSTSLLKEELTRIPIWGRSSFARCLIKVNSEANLEDSVTIGIPSLTGDDFTKETIHVKYEWRPPRCDECKIFGHVHDHCPKNLVNPPIVTTSNVVAPTVEKSNDGFQTVGKKKKRKGKSKSTNGGQFTGPSVKQTVRYEPKATTIAPKKGATNVSNPSKSSSMLKTADTSPKNDNFTISNSFSALNDEEEYDEEFENVYDESANLVPNTNASGSSYFTTATDMEEGKALEDVKAKCLHCGEMFLRTDHGWEFDNEVQFRNYCDSNGITHNFSALCTPQSNGSSPPKISPLEDDDLVKEEAINVSKKKPLGNDVEDEILKNDKIVNIKESKSHPLENVIANLNKRTLRSQAQDKSNFFCFLSTIEPKNVDEALKDESWVVVMQEELNQFTANDVWELVPNPKSMTVIGTKWDFRNKLDENGVLRIENKAKRVFSGSFQSRVIIIQDQDKVRKSPKHAIGKSARLRVRRCLRCLLGQPVTHFMGEDENAEDVQMADHLRPMKELLQIPIVGAAETWLENEPPCSITTLDFFYNRLCQSDQDSLNSIAGGNLMTRNIQEALTTIENKAKVRTCKNKPQVSSSSGSSIQNDAITSLTKQVEALGHHISSVLPNDTETYPREECKAVTTMSGLTLDGYFIPHSNFLVYQDKELEPETITEVVEIASSQSTPLVPPPETLPLSTPKPEEDPKPNPHQPSIPYPSRLQEENFQALENPRDVLTISFIELILLILCAINFLLKIIL